MTWLNNRIYARQAWLGPGQIQRRVVVDFDNVILVVRELRDDEKSPPDAVTVDWLMPGLVNAHCHLEYSWLTGQLPRGPVPFGDWMRAIMSRRPHGPDDQQQRNDAMKQAAQALVAGGCTAVFDSSTDGASAPFLEQAGLRYFMFHEVLGLSRERAEPLWRAAVARCAVGNRFETSRSLGAGLNPHAPYSVGAWLRQKLNSEEAGRRTQAWHLAETPDEEELFRSGSGSIATFLQEFGMPLPAGRWESSWDFLNREDLLEQCELVFHGNELSTEQATYFSAPRGVVHCPGTHRWFDRSSAPLRQWLDAGVNVCLGTDSLASADTVSMLDVVRMTLEDHPDLSVDDVLTMACRNPWRLGFMQSARVNGGRIHVGALADFVALDHTGKTAFDEGDASRSILMNRDHPQVRVWIAGKVQ